MRPNTIPSSRVAVLLLVFLLPLSAHAGRKSVKREVAADYWSIGPAPEQVSHFDSRNNVVGKIVASIVKSPWPMQPVGYPALVTPDGDADRAKLLELDDANPSRVLMVSYGFCSSRVDAQAIADILKPLVPDVRLYKTRGLLEGSCPKVLVPADEALARATRYAQGQFLIVLAIGGPEEIHNAFDAIRNKTPFLPGATGYVENASVVDDDTPKARAAVLGACVEREQAQKIADSVKDLVPGVRVLQSRELSYPECPEIVDPVQARRDADRKALEGYKPVKTWPDATTPDAEWRTYAFTERCSRNGGTVQTVKVRLVKGEDVLAEQVFRGRCEKAGVDDWVVSAVSFGGRTWLLAHSTQRQHAHYEGTGQYDALWFLDDGGIKQAMSFRCDPARLLPPKGDGREIWETCPAPKGETRYRWTWSDKTRAFEDSTPSDVRDANTVADPPPEGD